MGWFTNLVSFIASGSNFGGNSFISDLTADLGSATDGFDLAGLGGATDMWGALGNWGGSDIAGPTFTTPAGLDLGTSSFGDLGTASFGSPGLSFSPEDLSGISGAETIAIGGAPIYSGYGKPDEDPMARAAAEAPRGSSYGVSNTATGRPDPDRSFGDRLTEAATNPATYLRLGLAAMGGAGGSTAPKNLQSAYSTFKGQDAAAREENAGLRTQINTNARNLQESGGANAFRSAQVRGANEVAALEKQLGYTNSPIAVKKALVGKAQQRAGLNAQTAAVQGDVAARTAAAGLYKMAPDASSAGMTYANTLDSANNEAQKGRQRNMGAIGSAVEDVFEYRRDQAYKDANYEGTRP